MELRPINNDDIERSVLGACLGDLESVIMDQVKPEDFYSDKHKAIFQAIKSLYESRAPIDPLSLSNKLKTMGWEVSPSKIIEDLSDRYFLGLNIDFYIDQLRTYSKRRNLQASLSHALQAVQNLSTPYSDLEEEITHRVMEILDDGKDREPKTSEVMIRDVIDIYYRRKVEREKGRRLFGVPTGFMSIDRTLGGLQNGTLGILAGRQHHGKSTVATDIFNGAVIEKIPSLYISLEQPSSDILLYLIQKKTGIKPLSIKTGNLTEEEEKTLTQEIYSQIKALPVFLEDRVRTLNEIAMKIRRMVVSHNVRFVVIDYLQLIENRLKGEARHIEVAGISRALKRLAMDLNIPILALSQLNKNPEERETKKIYLSDMRESEAISQDADYVIFIHRPTLMGRDDKDHLELAKNRHGETIPRINVSFDRTKNTYREINGR